MLLAIFIAFSSFAHAASTSYWKEEAQIPKTPTTPPALTQQIQGEVPHCERYFLYQGRRIECDSNVRRDAQNLRPLMHDVPAALAELNTYEENQKKIRVAGYVGTIGLLAVIAGVMISRPPFDPGSGAFRPGGYVLVGGLGLAANSLVYGLSTIKTNESHIGNAVQYFNAAHPDRPIELQFSTRVNF